MPVAEENPDRRKWPSHSVASRRGLTLLELLLALALMSLLLVAISMAVNLHLRALDARRADVEQARLARAVLRLIANDVRGALQPRPIDLSGLPDISQLVSELAGAQADGGGGQPSGTESDEEQAGADPQDTAADDPALGLDSQQTDDATSAEEEASTSIATSAVPATVPGVYGNQFELQVDVSRLPRADQYQAMISTEPTTTEITTTTDLPTDVKTIAYYVAAEEPDLADNPDTPTSSGGLVRRELDRSVTQWAAEYGDTIGLSTSGVVIAPEIVSIEFQYFDGLEWFSEWDSETNGGVPVAIDVTIGMRPLRQSNSSSAGSTMDLIALEEELHYYNLVIQIPMSEPATEEAVDGGL